MCDPHDLDCDLFVRCVETLAPVGERAGSLSLGGVISET